MLAELNEAVTGRAVIKGFGLERPIRGRFVERLITLSRTSMRAAFLSSLLERSASGGILLLQVGVLGVGGTMAYRGSLTVGALVAFQSLFLSMSAALFYLAQFVPTLSTAAASLCRLDEIMQEPSHITEAPSPRPLPALTDAITVDGVAFSHDADTPTIEGVSLTIQSGESVALVGPSGSGKTTLLGLLLRFHDPDVGAVRYDGVDLRHASRADLVRQVAVVFQDCFLFNVSLRENIRFGRLDATDVEVEAAARDAEIHDFIMSLPRGYATPAGEGGAALSGGQRQRIAIARALVRNPAVLFLDEATSALDPGAEAAIRRTIARVSRGRTVVSVTHRLSSAMDFDRLFVLDRGRLAGVGTHRSLLAEGGLYASLWRKQSGLQLSEDGTQAAVTVDRLREIPLLSTLEESLLDRLANERLVSESVPAGRAVVIEGDPGDKFFIVVRGSLAVTRSTVGSPAATPRRLAVLQDGDHFGEIALIRNVPRTATVTTLSDTTLLSLQRGHFTALLDQAPGLRDLLQSKLAAREREWGEDEFSGDRTPHRRSERAL
jgi:ATP-binding cassette subfamily B protein